MRCSCAAELRGDVAPADDRPGDQLRKEQDVEREIGQPALGAGLALVDVDHVRDCVEREERDAERQRDGADRDRRDAQCRRDRIDVGEGEIPVLEHGERREVRGDRGAEPAPARAGVGGAADGETETPVRQHRADDQHDVRAFAPDVEREARHQQHRVLRAVRDERIRRQRQWQEQEQEDRGGEDHEEVRATKSPRSRARGPRASRLCAHCDRCGS